MNKILIIASFLLCSVLSTFAAAPSWSVDVAKYSSTMTITGIVSVAGVESNNANDLVAAFVGTECRGVAKLLPSKDLGRAYIYLVVQSNAASTETISFKIYNAAKDETISVPDQQSFVGESIIGSQTLPYIFSDVTVDGSQLSSFTALKSNTAATIDAAAHTISLSLPDSVALSKVSVDFLLSAGAKVYAGEQEVSTGDTLDLSSVVSLKVVAQNGTSTVWTVNATQATKVSIAELAAPSISFTATGLLFHNVPSSAQIRIINLNGQQVFYSKNLPNFLSFDAIQLQQFVVYITDGDTVLLQQLVCN